MLRGLGQDGGPQLRGDLLQVQRHLLLVRALSNASQLGERVALALLEQAGQVLVSSSRDIRAGQDIDGLTNSFNLLATKLLALLEILALHGALGRQVAEVLAVCSQIRLLIGLLAHRLSRALLLVGLALCLPGSLLLCAFNLVIQGLDHHLVVVLLVQLLLLQVTALASELVLQILQHVNDAATLELIRVGFRCLVVDVTSAGALQESGQHTAGVLRQKLASNLLDLQQALLGLGNISRHLLQGLDCSVQGVQGLGIVLVGCAVVRPFLPTNFSGSLDVRLVGVHVLVQGCNFLGQGFDVGVQHTDLSIQLFNGGLLLGDGLALLGVCVLAPLLELGESDLLSLLLLLALGHHSLEELNDLLSGGDSGGRSHACQGQNNLHGPPRNWVTQFCFCGRRPTEKLVLT
mmetsp:Transcript_85194/g.227750  ORF Transcript_85194/g.227750 Transcript_85194/m.227750 type:complete len:405 (+) Transcript_85194:937-2151(+)